MVPGSKKTNKGVDKEMKTAIVYYSLEGNTKYTADKISELLKTSCEVDVIRIEPEKSYPNKGFKKFFWGNTIESSLVRRFGQALLRPPSELLSMRILR